MPLNPPCHNPASTNQDETLYFHQNLHQIIPLQNNTDTQQPNKISTAPNHPLFPSVGNTRTLPKLNNGVTEKQKTTKQSSRRTKPISLFYDNGFTHNTIEELKGRTFQDDHVFGIMMLYGYHLFHIVTIKTIGGTTGN